MKTCLLLVGSCVIASVALNCFAGGVEEPSPGTGRLTISVDGQTVPIAKLNAIQLANGLDRYVGTFYGPAGIEFAIDYVVDKTNDPMASIAGFFKCTNTSQLARQVDATFEVSLCPEIAGGTLYGGNLIILVTANANGGGIWCGDAAPSVWQALISKNVAHTIYNCPFQMSTTGSGTMQSSQVFGAPIPGLVGPDSAGSAGTRNNFTITSGESVKLTSQLYIKTLGNPRGCEPDLNGDGIIDAKDLAILLGSWGQALTQCDLADIDGNGEIDAGDLAFILANWGLCGG